MAHDPAVSRPELERSYPVVEVVSASGKRKGLEKRPLPARYPWLSIGAAAIAGAATAKWFHIGRRRKLPAAATPVALIERPPGQVKPVPLAARQVVVDAFSTALSSASEAAGAAISGAAPGRTHQRSKRAAGCSETGDRDLSEDGSAGAGASGTPPPAEPRGDAQSEGKKRTKETTEERSWWGLIKQTFNDFLADKAMELGAALAYYGAFSLAPLLVIALAVAGWFYGEQQARGEVNARLQQYVGQDAAAVVEHMMEATNRHGAGIWAGIAGGIALLVAGSGVFVELQSALNTVWNIEPKSGGMWETVKGRFWSFVMVLGIGLLLLAAVVASTVLNSLSGALSQWLPSPGVVGHIINLAVTFVVVTLLMAAVYKVLPDVKISWGDVWIGSAVTSLLFVIGMYLFGLYLGYSAIGSTYGAAASLMIVLLWAYYTALIVLIGAEFTQAYARMYGSQIRPADDARRVPTQTGAPQDRTGKKADARA